MSIKFKVPSGEIEYELVEPFNVLPPVYPKDKLLWVEVKKVGPEKLCPPIAIGDLVYENPINLGEREARIVLTISEHGEFYSFVQPDNGRLGYGGSPKYITRIIRNGALLWEKNK